MVKKKQEPKKNLHQRTIAAANMMKNDGLTIRPIAEQLQVSKSTIFNDLKNRLPEFNPDLAEEINDILMRNLRNWHLAGGEATKEKWRIIKDQQRGLKRAIES